MDDPQSLSRSETPRLLLTICESGDLLRISRSKLYELMAEGQLHPVRIGRAVRFRISDLEDFASRNVTR
jgi:excisionase family DNA binding protein